MINKSCQFYDGDGDCHKCTIHGYVFTCADCEDCNAILCQACNRYFVPKKLPDGLPTGIQFILDDGTKLDVCSECILYHPELCVDAIDKMKGD